LTAELISPTGGTSKPDSHLRARASGDYSSPDIDPGLGDAIPVSPGSPSCMQEKNSFPNFVNENNHYRPVLDRCLFSRLE
jgi:hypothetical protein